MSKNSLYEQLMMSEPMGLIDPLTDLGEFDFVQMKFKEPLEIWSINILETPTVHLGKKKWIGMTI